MALVRRPVHREDGQAKTFVKICITLQVPGMSQGRFVRLLRPPSSCDLYYTILIILYYIPNKSLYLGCIIYLIPNKSLYLGCIISQNWLNL